MKDAGIIFIHAGPGQKNGGPSLRPASTSRKGRGRGGVSVAWITELLLKFKCKEGLVPRKSYSVRKWCLRVAICGQNLGAQDTISGKDRAEGRECFLDVQVCVQMPGKNVLVQVWGRQAQAEMVQGWRGCGKSIGPIQDTGLPLSGWVNT